MPNIDLMKAPHGGARADPAEEHAATPIANENPIGAALAGLGKLFDTADVVTGSGQLDVLRYGRIFKARQLARCAAPAPTTTGKYYVKSVTHNIKRGEYKQSFTLARGGIGSSVVDGERMSEGQKILRHLSRHGGQQHRSDADRPHHGDRARCRRRDAVHLGDACVPLAGKQMGTFMVPQIGAGVWMQFEGGDPDYPVWTGGWWGNAAEVPALALAGVPGDPNIVLQTTLQNAVVVSDLPGRPAGSC